MPWSKLDDQFHCHPKVIAAGSDGVALFVLGLSWCGGSLTNGFIPETQVSRLSLSDNSSAIAEQLVEVGLWERRDGGYQIHDYLKYNPSATQIKARRAASAERQARWRGERMSELEGAQENGKSNGVTNAVIDTVTNAAPVPVPVPVPESPSPKDGTPLAATAPTSEPKSKRKSSKPKKPPTPEAVKVFRENAHRYPPKAWYPKIVEAVGEKPANLEFWGQVVLAYIGLGWNPGNVKNMLAYYEKREIPATKGQQKGDARNAPDEWLARRQEAGIGGPS